MAYLPVVLVVLSSVAYHYCQKTISPQSNPFAVLAVSYAAASVATFVMLFLTGGSLSQFRDAKLLSAAPIVLGFSLFGIELGYLLSYRANWPISTTAVISHISADCFLLVIGLLAFGEELTPQKGMGLFLACLGIVVCFKAS